MPYVLLISCSLFSVYTKYSPEFKLSSIFNSISRHKPIVSLDPPDTQTHLKGIILCLAQSLMSELQQNIP